MSWFAIAVLQCFVLLSAATLIGRAVARRLPFRIRPVVAFYLSPSIGLSVWLLVSVPWGWVAGYGNLWAVRLLPIILVMCSLLLLRGERRLWLHLCLIGGIALIAGSPILLQLWKAEAYTPYNDAFTYLAQAQWLQDHSFGERPEVSFHPAWTQILSYQDFNMRMGATFFLGWIQSVCGSRWSYQVYPVALTLAATAGAMALAGGLTAVLRLRRGKALVAGLCLPLALNGFNFSIVAGFFPQAFGLLFALAGTVLLGLGFQAAASRASTVSLRWMALSVGFCLAASIHAYIELSPFLAAACGLACVAALALRSGDRPAIIFHSLWVALITVALVNAEWIRLYRGVIAQAKGGPLIGKPVPWPVGEYVMHSLGWRGSFFEQSGGFPGQTIVTALGSLALLAMVAGLFVAMWRRRSGNLTLIPHFALLFTFILGFIYFRYFVKPPWPVGVGQSWNQHKLADWASPSLLLLVLVAVALGLRRWRFGRSVFFVIVVGAFLLSLYRNVVRVDGRTSSIRARTGTDFAPFLVYERLREEVLRTVPAGETIYLDIPDDLNTQEMESRQMITYFLNDRRLLSHWTDDLYIYGLPPEQMEASMEGAEWVVSSRSWPGVPQSRRHHRWQLFPRPERYLYLSYTQKPMDNWNTSAHVVSFQGEVRMPANNAAQFRLRGAVRAPDPSALVEIRLVGGGLAQSGRLVVSSNGQFDIGPFSAAAGKLDLGFSYRVPAGQAMAGALIDAFRVEPLEVVVLSDPAGVMKVQ